MLWSACINIWTHWTEKIWAIKVEPLTSAHYDDDDDDDDSITVRANKNPTKPDTINCVVLFNELNLGVQNQASISRPMVFMTTYLLTYLKLYACVGEALGWLSIAIYWLLSLSLGFELRIELGLRHSCGIGLISTPTFSFNWANPNSELAMKATLDNCATFTSSLELVSYNSCLSVLA